MGHVDVTWRVGAGGWEAGERKEVAVREVVLRARVARATKGRRWCCGGGEGDGGGGRAAAG